MAGGLFGGVGVGVGIGLPLGLAVLGSAAIAIAVPAATVGLTYMGTRAIYRRIVGRRRRALADLFGRLVQEAEAEIAASAQESP